MQNITRLSDARNTSVQVSDIALFNLDDNFVDVKSAISNELYSNNIAYKDNENKDINVSELLRLMYAFDIENIQMIQQPPFKVILAKHRYLNVIKKHSKPPSINHLQNSFQS